MLTSMLTYGQDSTNANGITPYFSTGLSMTNSVDFKNTSYPSIEIGVIFDNLSFGGVFGRNNLSKTLTTGIDNYWVEGKIGYSFPLGSVDGYGVFGVGTYFGTSGSLFIEYGGGIYKSFGEHIGLFTQISNWDRITYLTVGFSLTL